MTVNERIYKSVLSSAKWNGLVQLDLPSKNYEETLDRYFLFIKPKSLLIMSIGRKTSLKSLKYAIQKCRNREIMPIFHMQKPMKKFSRYFQYAKYFLFDEKTDTDLSELDSSILDKVSVKAADGTVSTSDEAYEITDKGIADYIKKKFNMSIDL